MKTISPPAGKGVRELALGDIVPNAKIFIHKNIYELGEIAHEKSVVDIGCGYGRNKSLVEAVGGT